jgi:hypothetical protein
VDRIRILRVLEYEGPRDVVEGVISRSVHGERRVDGRDGSFVIRAATMGLYPEVLQVGTTEAQS